MVGDIKEYLALGGIAVAGIGAFFNLKSDVRMNKSDIQNVASIVAAIKERESAMLLAVQKLELSNAAADEQRRAVRDMLDSNKDDMHKLSDKIDTLLEKQTKLATELQERTKAHHS